MHLQVKFYSVSIVYNSYYSFVFSVGPQKCGKTSLILTLSGVDVNTIEYLPLTSDITSVIYNDTKFDFWDAQCSEDYFKLMPVR